MGRYESQRAIAARTISDRRRGRKRPLVWRWWVLRRALALSLALAAIGAAAWFAPIA